MRQLVTVPNGDCRIWRFASKGPERRELRFVRSDERAGKVQHSSALKHKSDCSQDSVDLPEATKSIAVGQRHIHRLLDQIFVVIRHKFPARCLQKRNGKIVHIGAFRATLTYDQPCLYGWNSSDLHPEIVPLRNNREAHP
jgi:hypothetical protein